MVIEKAMVTIAAFGPAKTQHNTAPKVPPGSGNARNNAKGIKLINEIKSATATKARRMFVVERNLRFLRTSVITSKFPATPKTTSIM